MGSTGAEVRAAADAARGRSRALRLIAVVTRARARRAVEASHRCHDRTSSTDRHYRSAWSDLSWRAAEHDLDEVLVSHDGEK
jgi:hypothetical protein